MVYNIISYHILVILCYVQTLHPLLEDGCDGVKCGFIGISNWALDPAKMNRGIFVQRGALDSKELQIIAKYVNTTIAVLTS